jgi:pilus assembly protein CpaC
VSLSKGSGRAVPNQREPEVNMSANPLPRANRARRLALISAVVASALCGPGYAQPQVKTVKVEERIAPVDVRPMRNVSVRRIQLTLNKSEVVEVGQSVSDSYVGAPDIADVLPVSDRTFYMLGKKIGTTNVTFFDRDKQLVSIIDIVVKPDLADVQADIRANSGEGGLRIKSQGDRTVLTGSAADALAVDRAMQAAPAGTLNLTQVKAPQQVMLKVRFVEINRRAGRELGVRFETGGRNGNARVGPFGQATPISQSGSGLFAAGKQVVNSAALGINPFAMIAGRLGPRDNPLDIFISALEEKGLARRLAEPNLVALSGDTASFHAGGEYPIPTNTTTSTGVPTTAITYREFGVRLTFTPIVLAGGMIHLKLQPEVSEIDPSVTVNTGGLSVPGLSKRTANTSIQLRDGQSFAIAGLLQNQSERAVEQLPWLGSVPIIGALFSSKSFHERETELVVIVTPHLVKPAKPGQQIATPLETSMPPNDLDFFASGKLELRRNMREFVTKEGLAVGPHGHLLPAIVGDPIAAPAVCASTYCATGQ